MKIYRKNLNFLWFFISVLSVGVVEAKSFFIEHAETGLIGDTYYLDATVNYQLSDQAKEALLKGVELTFELKIEVIRKKGLLWLFNKKVSQSVQRYTLKYQPLTQQYKVLHINSGKSRNLPSLSTATWILGIVADLPLLKQEEVNPKAQYVVRLKALFDIESLPVPIRLLAYFAPGWYMSSDWYVWPLEP
ncbi:MAG TPA: DUF4390 domain-containing protein [Crenotrichaceae bacterium]|nr:DUF4390 domain-containing protein [Crenotrichaceae bacterium]